MRQPYQIALAAALAGIAGLAVSYFAFGVKARSVEHRPPTLRKAFILIVRLKIVPGRMGDFLQLWKPLADHCLAHEADTFSYEAAISDKDEDTVIIFERYRSKESLTGPHQSSAAFLRFKQELADSGLVVDKSGESYIETNILRSSSAQEVFSSTSLAVSEVLLPRLQGPLRTDTAKFRASATATSEPHDGPRVGVNKDTNTIKLALASHGRTYGVVDIDNDADAVVPILEGHPEIFHQLDLCAAAAGTVLRATHLEADVKRLEAVGPALGAAARLVRVAPSVSIDELLVTIAGLIHRVVDAEGVSLFLANDSGRSLCCMYSDSYSSTCPASGRRQQLKTIPYGEGLPGTVALTRKPLRVALTGQDKAKLMGDASPIEDTISALCVPVAVPASMTTSTVQPQLLAVVQVVKLTNPTPFDPRDERSLCALAEEVAFVLDTCKHDLAYETILNVIDPSESPEAQRAYASASLLRHFWYGGRTPDLGAADARLSAAVGRHATPPSGCSASPPLSQHLLDERARHSRMAPSTHDLSHTQRTVKDAPNPIGGSRRSSVDDHHPSQYPPLTRAAVLTASFTALNISAHDGPDAFVVMASRLGLCDSGSPIALPTRGAIATALKSAAGAILRGYRPLPYHNWRHAIDTSHFFFIALDRIFTTNPSRQLASIDRLAGLVAALAHDIDHRGTTNSFERNALSELSLTYNTDSVLEHHHIAMLFRVLQATHLSKEHCGSTRHLAAGSLSPHVPAHTNILALNRASFTQLRKVAVAAVLGTDMARHAELVDLAQRRGADLQPQELATVLLHVADISAPLHPDFSVSYEWSERCNAEFHAQATYEVTEGLPTAPFMQSLERKQVRAQQQLMFLDFIIVPMWHTLNAAFPELADLSAALPAHRERYAVLSSPAQTSYQNFDSLPQSPGPLLSGVRRDDTEWPPKFEH